LAITEKLTAPFWLVEFERHQGAKTMTDGMGKIVSPDKAEEAVRCFTEMWCKGLFDCGPQEYECMAKEITERLEKR
jgi:hypothetical protein